MSTDLKRILEALLFAAESPLSLDQLAQVLETDDKKALSSALEELAKEYDFLERAFSLVEVAGGFRLRTRPEMGPWLRKLKRQSVTRLSRAALETLAIIAYKQPVLKAEIERIRGVEVSGVLKMLLERDLVRSVGRRDLPGRPLIYGTTKRFLEVFDLKDLNELPTLDEMESLLGETDADPFADQGDLFEPREDEGEGGLGDLAGEGVPDGDDHGGDEPYAALEDGDAADIDETADGPGEEAEGAAEPEPDQEAEAGDGPQNESGAPASQAEQTPETVHQEPDKVALSPVPDLAGEPSSGLDQAPADPKRQGEAAPQDSNEVEPPAPDSTPDPDDGPQAA